jgi:multidrug efflux pump subunit AcrA (membrane-fusion protein)
MVAAEIAAEVSGRVVERHDRLEAGVTVQPDELLLRLDPTDFQQRVVSARQQILSIESQLTGLEIEQARLAEQAELLLGERAVAERDLDRARDALAQGAGNESQVDARLQALNAVTRNQAVVLASLESVPPRRSSLRASLESARADLRLAEENLARTEIRAPFPGILQEIRFRVAEWVRAGEPVARVVDLSRIEVPLRLAQSASDAIAIGDTVTLRAEGAPGRSWAGSIVRIAPESDAATRSLTVFVEVRQRPDADAPLLRPGQFVMGEIRSADRTPALVVPRHSVNVDRVLVAAPRRDSDPAPPPGAVTPMVVVSALVHVAHHLEDRFPEIAEGETQWAVLDPIRETDAIRTLRAGDLVLVSNLESLRVGDMVDVRLPEPARAAARREGEQEPRP